MSENMKNSAELNFQIKNKEKNEIKEPDKYQVILLNDHYTTTDFVVEILMKVFHKPIIEATNIMLDVHKKGRGVVGLYIYDIAMTKIARVHELAKQKGFPLKCSLKKI